MKCSNPRLTHEYGRGWVLCFDVDSESTGLAKLAVDKHKDGYVDLTVDKWSDKRSLQANAYFHVLVGKIAEKLTISKAKAKNILLGKYGQREMVDDGPLIISILENVDMYEREDIHCIPVGHGVVNGRDFTHWALVRPSHEYDTKEMAALIDGTIADAKELGIETLSENEIKRMEAAWHTNQ